MRQKVQQFWLWVYDTSVLQIDGRENSGIQKSFAGISCKPAVFLTAGGSSEWGEYVGQWILNTL